MMAVLLSALKLAGVVAVIIVLVIVAVALCLMFIPVKYEGKGDIQSGEYDIKIHWFFRLIQFCFHSVHGSGDYYIRLFGKRTRFLDRDFLDGRKAKRAKRKKRKEERQKRKRKKKRDKKKKNIQLDTDPGSGSVKPCTKRENTGEQMEPETETADNGIKHRAKKIVKGAVGFLKIVQEHHPILFVWPPFQKFLFHIRPRVLKADLTFGFEDPSVTGKVLGAVSNLYFIYEFEDFHLSPDFEAEKTYLEGSFFIKGRMRGIHLLVFLIRMIRQKEFRKFLGALKKNRNGGKS